MEIRLHGMQLQLDMEQERRATAERHLREVEQECREPFVVPSLLEAFIKMSQLTSAAMDRAGSVE